VSSVGDRNSPVERKGQDELWLLAAGLRSRLNRELVPQLLDLLVAQLPR